MGIGLSQVRCPKCGQATLFINTEDWKPIQIRCRRFKCGWAVDLKQFWPDAKPDTLKSYI